MDIQAIGVRAYSVYIPESELRLRHIDPENITVGQARQLVDALLGDTSTDAVSLELYPGRHEVLIFVRRSPGEPEFYCFQDFEQVLEAVAALSDSVAASLYRLDGAWILVVWPEEGRTLARLADFGSPLDVPAWYLTHLREHALPVCDADAVAVLRRAFLER